MTRSQAAWWGRLICLSLALAWPAASARAADEVLRPIGGGGGSPFYARCSQGDVLTGFDLWSGDHVDAIRPICIPAVAGQFQPYPQRYGGDGGNGPRQYVCPNDTPVVIGMDVGVESAVNNIHLYCGRAVATPQPAQYPMAAYDGPVSRGTENCGLLYCDFTGFDAGSLRCPAGLVAVGLVGRSGKFLDSLGMICGSPPGPLLPPLVVAMPPEVKSQGRVPRPDGRSTGPSRPICELAQVARGRNSPAAPGLEAQCRARQAEIEALRVKGARIANDDPQAGALRDQLRAGPARRGFEIGLAAAEGQTAPGPGKDAIRDQLTPGEQDGFTTAVNFSLSHNRQQIADLAPRGRSIARQDPLAWELRGEQPDEQARLGFDIGMAAAEGQTARGPGKDARRDALPPAQRAGYQAAVDFSVDRNKNAELAAKGAAIARRDRFTAEARAAEADAMRRLGFDIATGIFGDPALGALGNTEPGPGSLGIRDGLSFLAQRGFSASMAFHRSRDYRR